jgi:hypothetical protein
MKRRVALALSFVAVLSAACTTVTSVSVSQIPEAGQRKNVVRSEASRPIILLIPFGSSFVEKARKDLLSRCPDGAIEGVVSKHEDTNYFLGLVQVASLTMRGYCVEKRRDAKKTSRT